MRGETLIRPQLYIERPTERDSVVVAQWLAKQLS
jgi:hypothetical protein